MKVVGLTGGIGSGKTTVVRMFESLGVPCYIADERAKLLIQTRADIQAKIIRLLGEEAFVNGEYQRHYVSCRVFSDAGLLRQLNEIVHPSVFEDFLQWKSSFAVSYVIKESAILLESGAWRDCRHIIHITAPLALRMERIRKRDGLSKEEILKRISQQLTDEQRKQCSDFHIENITLSQTFRQVREIHEILSKNEEKKIND